MTSTTSRSQRSEVNPRWVIFTLKERGLPMASAFQIERSLSRMSDGDRSEIEARVRRLGAGAEQPGDVEGLSTWTRDAALASPEPTSTRAPRVTEGSRAANDAPASSTDTSLPYQRGVHVYGGKAALTFELALATARRQEYATIKIEGAKALAGKQFEWDNKLVFRLTKRELALFAATLLGWLPKLEFTGHGEEKSKTLAVEDQGGVLFVRLTQGRRLLAVPIPAEEIFDVTALVLQALAQNEPHLDSQTILHLVKRAAAMLSAHLEQGQAPARGQA